MKFKKRQKGFSLIEVSLALGIIALMTGQISGQIAENAELVKAKATAAYTRTIIDAANDYGSVYHSGLWIIANSLSPKVTVRDVVNTSGNPASLTCSEESALNVCGFLPTGFENRNPYGQSYKVLYEAEGTTDQKKLNIYVVAQNSGTKPAQNIVALISAYIGPEGGFVDYRNTKNAIGSYGGWQILDLPTKFSSVDLDFMKNNEAAKGLFVANIGIQADSLLEDFLYRNELSGFDAANTMNTDLHMGLGLLDDHSDSFDITDVKNINILHDLVIDSDSTHKSYDTTNKVGFRGTEGTIKANQYYDSEQVMIQKKDTNGVLQRDPTTNEPILVRGRPKRDADGDLEFGTDPTTGKTILLMEETNDPLFYLDPAYISQIKGLAVSEDVSIDGDITSVVDIESIGDIQASITTSPQGSESGGTITARKELTSPDFKDLDDRAFNVDPNSYSVMKTIELGPKSYIRSYDPSSTAVLGALDITKDHFLNPGNDLTDANGNKIYSQIDDFRVTSRNVLPGVNSNGDLNPSNAPLLSDLLNEYIQRGTYLILGDGNLQDSPTTPHFIESSFIPFPDAVSATLLGTTAYAGYTGCKSGGVPKIILTAHGDPRASENSNVFSNINDIPTRNKIWYIEAVRESATVKVDLNVVKTPVLTDDTDVTVRGWRVWNLLYEPNAYNLRADLEGENSLCTSAEGCKGGKSRKLYIPLKTLVQTFCFYARKAPSVITTSPTTQ